MSTDSVSLQTQKFTCPMHAQIVQDAPGKCPICGMNLVPQIKLELGHAEVGRSISHEQITKEQKQNKGSIEYTCPMHPEVIRHALGSCPICGMDLVPKIIQKDGEEEEAAYQAMRKRFWIATAFTIPVFVIAMGEMTGLQLSKIASMTTWGWIQFALSTPVIFYCSADFFKRGYQSVEKWSPQYVDAYFAGRRVSVSVQYYSFGIP